MQINTKVGTKITINETVHGFDDTGNRKERTYTVTAVYPHMVLAECGNIRRCFSYGDLVRLGLERQSDNIEALRM